MKLHSNTATPEVHAARVNQKLLEWEHEQPNPIDIATDYVDLENDLGCVVSINAHISYKYADIIDALPALRDVERLIEDYMHRRQELEKYDPHIDEAGAHGDMIAGINAELEKLSRLQKIVTYHAAQKGR